MVWLKEFSCKFPDPKSALGLLGGLVASAAERARKQEERAEQRAARKEKQIEAEMQALSAPPQEWKAAAQAYLAQKAWASFRAQEQASASLPPKEQPRPWWQRAWDAVTHPVPTFENALVKWGSRSPTGYKIIGGLAHVTAGLNDPERNPVTASFGKALRDGWAGFSYGVRSTLDLTYKTGASLLKGDWGGVKRYGGALLEGTLKGWLWGGIQTVGQLVWGGIKMATPIGLFETGPTWWSAIKDARAGKRGGWDVVFTSLLLMANVIGIAGAVNGVQTQATRTALVREYGEPVRPLLAERKVIPLLKNGELAPKPWREYVPPKDWSAFDGEGVAVKLNDMAGVYRYWGGKSLELGRWTTIYSNSHLDKIDFDAIYGGSARELTATYTVKTYFV